MKKKPKPQRPVIQIRDPDGSLGTLLDEVGAYHGITSRAGVVKLLATKARRAMPPAVK